MKTRGYCCKKNHSFKLFFSTIENYRKHWNVFAKKSLNSFINWIRGRKSCCCIVCCVNEWEGDRQPDWETSLALEIKKRPIGSKLHGSTRNWSDPLMFLLFHCVCSGHMYNYQAAPRKNRRKVWSESHLIHQVVEAFGSTGLSAAPVRVNCRVILAASFWSKTSLLGRSVAYVSEGLWEESHSPICNNEPTDQHSLSVNATKEFYNPVRELFYEKGTIKKTFEAVWIIVVGLSFSLLSGIQNYLLVLLTSGKLVLGMKLVLYRPRT